MQAKYIKSKRADYDIKHIITRSLADFGELQTDTYMQGFERALCELAEMPDKGRVFISGKTGREYSRYRYVSHVIYYRKRQDDIFIVRVLHEKMLPENHLWILAPELLNKSWVSATMLPMQWFALPWQQIDWVPTIAG